MIEWFTRLFCAETPEQAIARVRAEIRRENLRAVVSLPSYRREAGSTDHELAQLRAHRIQVRP